MMMTLDGVYETLFIFFGLFFIAYVYFKRTQSAEERWYYETLAPRITAIPWIGSLPFLPPMQQMHVWFFKKLRTMGSVVGLLVRTRYTVVLQTREALDDAFVKRSGTFASRPSLFVNKIMNPGRFGITDRPSDVTFAQDHNRVLTVLRRLGFGDRNVMEHRIDQEIDGLLSRLDCSEARSASGLDPAEPLVTTLVNVMAKVLFGRGYRRIESRVDEIMDTVRHYWTEIIQLRSVNHFPLLRFTPSNRRKITGVTRLHERVMTFATDGIDDVIASMTSSKNGDGKQNEDVSFVQLYVEMDGGASGYDDDQLCYIVRDLLLVGLETTASAMLWAVALLADNPDIQRKLQAEIDSIASSQDSEFRPRLTDRSRLPYVDATILEIFRYKTVTPMPFARESVGNAMTDGYHIPVGSTVLANLYALHMDPMVWNDPDVFRPERFLVETGDITLRDRVIPFSIALGIRNLSVGLGLKCLGKRSCPGESLAQHEIFLFITSLMRNYSILPPEGRSRVDCHETVGFTVAPSPFKVRFVPRSLRTTNARDD